jgi:hypothetical protein
MKLFSFYNIGMDVYNDRIVFFNSNFIKKEYKSNANISIELIKRINELINITIKELPFSFLRSKLLIVLSGDENIKQLNKAEEIIYNNGKNKIKELHWINYGVLIISVFKKYNKCIFLVHINNEIYGFAGYAGSMITNGYMFNDNLSIGEMIKQLKNEIPENIPEKIINLLKNKKEINLNELWDNEEIIISLEPDYFNKNIKDNIIYKEKIII